MKVSPFAFEILDMDSKLNRTNDFASFNAASANSKPFYLAILDDANILKIRKPASFSPGRSKCPRARVNVPDILSKLRPLATDITNVSHNSKDASCALDPHRPKGVGAKRKVNYTIQDRL